MARIVRGGVFFLGLLVSATVYAGTPAIKVCVSDEGGNVAFKQLVQAGTPFVTGDLKPGNYVVQFNSSRAAVKDHQYLVVVSAGQNKVVADSVPGEKFAGGGVAMKVKVGAGLKITGQVAPVSPTASTKDHPSRMIDPVKVKQTQDRFGEGVHNHLADRPYLRSY